MRPALVPVLFAALAKACFAFVPSGFFRSGAFLSWSPSTHRPRLPTAPRAPEHKFPIGRASIRLHADFYQELGVSKAATEREIKSAFRKKAKVCHPDVDPSKSAEWARVNRAYEVLSDPDQRKRFDMFGEAGVQGAAEQSGDGPGGQQVDLNDIFESFFGGGGGGFGGSPFGQAGGRRQSRGPQRGDDLRFDLEVDFIKACFGGEEKIKIRHLENCENCKGDGIKPGTRKRTCGTCQGQGVVLQVTRTPMGNFQTQSGCPTCRGSGEIIDEYCPKCSGQGTTQVAKQVSLTIPAGVEPGQKLRVRSEGDAGPKGGPPGDLYIFIKVKKNDKFRREGTEIYSDIEIPFTDAILGAEKSIATIDGEVTIKIPSGSQPETVLRIKGKGAPKLGDSNVRGNHFVTLKVRIPGNLSPKEKKIVEELRSLHSNK